MSVIHRWAAPALLLFMATSGAAPAADEGPRPADAKAVDQTVHKTLRDVINEGADMYNGQGRYKNMERDYAGCYHLYEGALLTIRPFLSEHADLQKALDDALENARNTPRMEMRAFVLREMIDKIRDQTGGNAAPPKTVVGPLPPPSPAETTAVGKAVGVDNGKLTFDADGKERTVAVPPDAKVLIDGKDGKLDEIKKDGVVTVTSKGDVVAKVEVRNPPPPLPAETTVSGKVVAAKENKLTASVEGKERTFSVPDSAKVTIDDKAGALADLKDGAAVTITARGDVVSKVEAKSPAAPPPPPPPAPAKETKTTGKITKVDGDKVTVKPESGGEHTVTVLDVTKVTIDGKSATSADIRVDATATITEKDGAVVNVDVKSPTTSSPPTAGTQTLWDRLGGDVGVAKAVDDFLNAAVQDPKVNFYRDPTITPSREEAAALKKMFVEYVSSVTGGPLKYTGKNMKDAHKGMKITDDEFDAAKADLKTALEKNAAKPDDVKAVLAAVEGTRKDVVEAKAPEDKPKAPDEKKPADKPADKGGVKGKVTFKGAPLPGGVVTFTPAQGKPRKADLTAEGGYGCSTWTWASTRSAWTRKA